MYKDETLCIEKRDLVIKKAKYRHELKGSIRNLRFILDELECDEISENENLQLKCFNDFDTDLEKIKASWINYKSFLTKGDCKNKK